MPAIDQPNNPDKIDIRPDRISKNSLWIALGLIGNASLYFVTIFFLTRYLGPEKFGLYSVAISLAGLFLPLADLGLDLHMTRMISADPQLLRHELSRAISAKIVLSVIFWFMMISTAYMLDYSATLIGYVSLIGFSLLVGSMAHSFIGAIRAVRKMRYESISLFSGKMVAMLAILSMIAMEANLTMIMIAHLAGSITLVSASFYFLKSQVGPLDFRFSLKGLKWRLKGALPYGLTAFLVAIYFKIDTVMLSKMVETAEIGFYNGAYNLVLASMILSTPLVVALFPVLSSLYDNRRSEAENIFQRGLKYSIMIGLPLGVGSVLMAEPVIMLAYGAQFHQSVALLIIMSGTIPLLFATSLIGNSMGAVGFQARVAVVASVNVVFNIVMNLILIPKIGATGAAIATILTEFLGLIQLILLSRGIYKLNIAADFLKICLSCVLAFLGFILLDGFIGPWPSAVVFMLIYSGGILWMRVTSIDMFKGFLRSAGNS